MKRIILYRTGLLLAVLAVLFQGCNKDNDQELKDQEMRLLQQYLDDNNITQEPTASGLYYIPITEGNGNMAGTNYWADFNYATKLVDGTYIFTSYEDVAKEYNLYREGVMYGPVRLLIGQTSIPGLNEGLAMMREGGISTMIMPSDINGLGENSTEFSPPYSTHIYTVELVHAFDDPEAFQTTQIINYLNEQGIEDPLITESGLYYIEQEAGIGEQIKDGDIVDLWYTGTFLDGREFDSNVGGTVMTVDMPAQGYIPGWGEAIKLMKLGTRAKVIIPYQLGYGASQSGPIPPYMTLVFDIEIDDVIPL